jgi:predicted secreted protein
MASPSAAASSAASPAATVSGSGITARRNGQSLSVNVGDTFYVRIPTIPRAGFTWQPQHLNTSILSQLDGPVYEPDPSPNAAGGVVVLRFKVVGPGHTDLALIYASSSSSGAPSLYSDSFGISIDAK